MSVKGCVISRVQGSRGFLVAWQISRHDRHESVGGRLCTEETFAVRVTFACLIYQAAQDSRRAAGLRLKLLPVPRQERHFAGHDTELGTPAASRFLGWLSAGKDLVEFAAEIEVNGPTRVIVEDDEGRRRVKIVGFDPRNDVDQRTGSQSAGPVKCGVDLVHIQILPRYKPAVNITRVIIKLLWRHTLKAMTTVD